MSIWLVLFFIVLFVSFILALRSMSDYREKPLNFTPVYSLYLIQKPQALTMEMLDKLYQQLLPDGLILSFERLFKGHKKALVVFGPASVLRQFDSQLGLLELEDYSQAINLEKINSPESVFLIWQMGFKGNKSGEGGVLSLPVNLESHEQFWWQAVLRPDKKDRWQGVIRAAVTAVTRSRASILSEGLSAIGNLSLIPQAKTAFQLAKDYQERSISAEEFSPLSSQAVLALLFLTAR